MIHKWNTNSDSAFYIKSIRDDSCIIREIQKPMQIHDEPGFAMSEDAKVELTKRLKHGRAAGHSERRFLEAVMIVNQAIRINA